MLCGICKTREARVFFTEISGGVRRKQCLCEECAAKATGMNMALPFGEGEMTLGGFISGILAGVAKQEHFMEEDTEQEESESTAFEDTDDEQADDVQEADAVRCKKCGMTYGEFRRKNRLGCAECYHSFEQQLTQSFWQLQGTRQHANSTAKPKKRAKKHPKLTKKEQLALQLEFAVEQEDYKLAAQLRDELRTLEMNGVCDG